jgi:hypothetical protein
MALLTFSFLNSNALPIEKMITFLKEFFSPNEYDGNVSCHIIDSLIYF